MKGIVKVAIGVSIAIFLMVIVLVGALALGANEVSKAVKADHAKGAEYSMSKKEFKSVKTGVRFKDFVAEYGQPDPDLTQVSEVDGLKNKTVYYQVEGGDLMDTFQFSFDNGRLVSKSKF